MSEKKEGIIDEMKELSQTLFGNCVWCNNKEIGDNLITCNECSKLHSLEESKEKAMQELKRLNKDEDEEGKTFLIDGNVLEQFDEIWNQLCNEVFDYHNKELVKLDDLKQKSDYINKMSELEQTIYYAIDVGGTINPELVSSHKDFEKILNKFAEKALDKLADG